MNIPYNYVNGVLLASYSFGLSTYAKPNADPLFNLTDTVDFINYILSQNHFCIVDKLFNRDKDLYRRMYKYLKSDTVDYEALVNCLNFYYIDMYNAIKNTIIDSIISKYLDPITSCFYDKDENKFVESYEFLNDFDGFMISCEYNWNTESLVPYKFSYSKIKENLNLLLEGNMIEDDFYIDFILDFPMKYKKYLEVNDSLINAFIMFVMSRKKECYHVIQ